VVAALAGYLIGHAGGEGGASAWAGLSMGLLVIIVAAAAFEFGRRSSGSAQAPVIVLDSVLLARIGAKDAAP
jgi:hypothetical protein